MHGHRLAIRKLFSSIRKRPPVFLNPSLSRANLLDYRHACCRVSLFHFAYFPANFPITGISRSGGLFPLFARCPMVFHWQRASSVRVLTMILLCSDFRAAETSRRGSRRLFFRHCDSRLNASRDNDGQTKKQPRIFSVFIP